MIEINRHPTYTRYLSIVSTTAKTFRGKLRAIKKMATESPCVIRDGISRIVPTRKQEQSLDRAQRIERRATKWHSQHPTREAPANYSLELVASIHAKVLSLRAKQFEKIIVENNHYRVAEGRWAGGNHSVRVTLTSDPTLVSCNGGSTIAWSGNGKWKGKDSSNEFTVHESVSSGNMIMGGLVNLHLVEIGKNQFEAIWVEQSRGFNLKSVAGYITDGVHIQKKTKLSAEQLEAKKSALIKGEWDSQIEATEIGEYRLKPLKSHAELRREGREMKNCIGNGTYTEEARKGLRRYFHVEKQGKKYATVEVSGNKITQAKGACNSAVSLPDEVVAILTAEQPNVPTER